MCSCGVGGEEGGIEGDREEKGREEKDEENRRIRKKVEEKRRQPLQREMDTHTFHFLAQKEARSKQTDDDDEEGKKAEGRNKKQKIKRGRAVNAYFLVVQLIRALVRLFSNFLGVPLSLSLLLPFSLPLYRDNPLCLSLISCFLCTPFSLRPRFGACVVGIKNRVLWCEKV